MKLDDKVWRSFQISKVFRENNNKINALDYSASGELMISSSDDDSIVIYDCEEGKYVLEKYHKQIVHVIKTSFRPGFML